MDGSKLVMHGKCSDLCNGTRRCPRKQVMAKRSLHVKSELCIEIGTVQVVGVPQKNGLAVCLKDWLTWSVGSIETGRCSGAIAARRCCCTRQAGRSRRIGKTTTTKALVTRISNARIPEYSVLTLVTLLLLSTVAVSTLSTSKDPCQKKKKMLMSMLFFFFFPFILCIFDNKFPTHESQIKYSFF